jgi:peptidoglycan/LPS O-acetylase OafA/YrhL
MKQVLLWLLVIVIALFLYVALPEYNLPFVPFVLQFRFLPWTNEFAFALCYGYLVTAVLLNPASGWLTRLFSWTPLRWLGLISYSLYIWHRPLTLILAANVGQYFQRLHPVLTMSLFWLTAFMVTVVFCFFLFVLIEKPGMRLSEQLRQQILQREADKLDATQKLPRISKESSAPDVAPIRS